MKEPLCLVAPSQLSSFKAQAKTLAESISEITSRKRVKLRRAHDFAAIACNYTSYSDVVSRSKGIEYCGDPLVALPVNHWTKISESLSDSYGITHAEALAALEALSKQYSGYLGGLVVKEVKDALAPAFSSEITGEESDCVNKTPELPFRIVMDEVGMYFDSMKKATYSDISDLMEFLGLNDQLWHVYETAEDPEVNIACLQVVAEQIRTDIMESDNYFPWRVKDESKLRLKKRVINLVEMNLISASEYIGRHYDDNFSVLGFGIKKTQDHQDLFWLYNKQLRAIYPTSYESLELAKQELAYLMKTGRFSDPDVSTYLPIDWSLIDPDLPKCSSGLKLFDLPCGRGKVFIDNTVNVTPDILPEEGLLARPFINEGDVLHSGKSKSKIVWQGGPIERLSVESADSWQRQSEELKGSWKMHMGKVGIEPCIPALKGLARDIHKTNEIEFLMVSEREYRKEFPALVRYLSIPEVEKWHKEAAEHHGYKMCSYLHLDEMETALHGLYVMLMGEDPPLFSDAEYYLGYLLATGQYKYKDVELKYALESYEKIHLSISGWAYRIREINHEMSRQMAERGAGNIPYSMSRTMREGRKFGVAVRHPPCLKGRA
ncbi:hypothetical protein [Neptuniibacter sp. QD37_11]|uniref:hypothetical protein n=1 Tax=Neptuniibacter sp. QD37_11 TaxID=3398209 RepID=UPI0039F4D8FC